MLVEITGLPTKLGDSIPSVMMYWRDVLADSTSIQHLALSSHEKGVALLDHVASKYDGKTVGNLVELLMKLSDSENLIKDIMFVFENHLVS